MPNASTKSSSAHNRVVADSVALWDRDSGDASYLKFKRKYWSDPVGFARDCIIWPEGHSLTSYQREILSALVSKKRVSVRGPHGLGKCLEFNELVRLADGSMVEARHLIGQRFQVLSLNPDRSITKEWAVAWDNGIKDTVVITTDKGRVIKRTLNHPLLADKNPKKYISGEGRERFSPTGSWVKAGNLKPGATVAVFLGGCPTEPYDISDDEIKIIAYLIADGCLTSGIGFSQIAGKQLDEVREICTALGCSLISDGSAANYRIRTADEKPSYGGNRIRNLVKSSGLHGKDSFEKFFPDWVWKLDRRQLALFMSRLWSCDGWAHCGYREDGRVNRNIGYCTVSKMLVRDVASALLRLGVQAEIRVKKTTWTHNGEKKSGKAYTVSVNDVDGINAFNRAFIIYAKEEAYENVVCSCLDASEDKQQGWRRLNLPDNMRWEKVKSVEIVRNTPTVGISVPTTETFITDFVEHNSGMAAISILWFALTRDLDDWKIPTTASAWRQLEKFLWPEVHKWARRINWSAVGREPFSDTTELFQVSLRLKTGEAFALASDDYNMIEGAHADHIMYLFDEAKTINPATWDAAEGAMINENSFWLAVSTPGEPSGRFYDIQSRKPGYNDWWVRRVTIQEAVDAGRVTMKWVDDRRTQWGETSAVFINRVMGDFASNEQDGVIPLSWVEEANERWVMWDENKPEVLPEPDQVGIDVARQGSDKTVFAERIGYTISNIEKYSKGDTMETAGRANKYIVGTHETISVVDVIGIGAGVFDRLYEQAPYRVFPFNAAESSEDATDISGTWKFVDKRSHSWWHMRELLDPANGFNVCLPPDDDLTGDLTAPTWKVTSNGRIRVEPKDMIRARIHRSTDCGDAVIQAFYPVSLGGMDFG